MIERGQPRMQLSDEKKESLEKQIEAARPILLNFIRGKMSDLTGESHLTPEDVTQQTMLNAVNNLNSIKDANITAWLFTMANNFIISELRHQKTVRDNQNNTSEALHPSHGHGESIVSDPPLRQRMLEAIMKLTPEHSATLRLRLDGNSIKEIASILKLSDAAVKSRLHQAKAKLKTLLADEGVDLGDELLK